MYARQRRSMLVPIILVGILAVAGVATALGSLVGNRSHGSAYVATMLDPPPKAQGFTLTDQTGKQFSLEQDRGKYVVLTFLFTHCTDVCPFVGVKLKNVSENLGRYSDSIDFVVVTVDPERDTVADIASYSREIGMYDRWHYVTGDRSDLESIWRAYYVGVGDVPQESSGSAGSTEKASGNDAALTTSLRNGLDAASIDLAGRVASEFGGGYEVDHSTPIWLIGPDQRLIATWPSSVKPDEIVGDLKHFIRSGARSIQ